MQDAANNLVISTLASGATAELRNLLRHADRETAQPIYRELVRLAHQVAEKHNFQLQQRAIPVAIVTFEQQRLTFE